MEMTKENQNLPPIVTCILQQLKVISRHLAEIMSAITSEEA